jgi:hypothetical protein
MTDDEATPTPRLGAPALAAVVDDAYRIFAPYRLTGAPLTVCHCDSCMTVETEQRLRTTPLREIPADLLGEYTNSAHGWSDEPVGRELRHFLPRYFELIALDEPPDAGGDLSTCLSRLAQPDWRGKWPAAEVEIIDRFFAEYLIACLPRLDLVHWPVGWRLAFDIADVLTLTGTARGDIHRVLAAWEAAPDPAAAIHMAAQMRHVTRSGRRIFHGSPLLERKREAANAIGIFLVRPEVDVRLHAAKALVTDPRLLAILDEGLAHRLPPP